MTSKQTRLRQYQVAKRVLHTSPGKELDDYNAAFRSADLPEIADFADLTMLINGDPMDPDTFRMHVQELLSVSGLEPGDDKTTMGEAIRKSGMSEEQADVIAEKGVHKRGGGLDN
jgi:hypothetical protein